MQDQRIGADHIHRPLHLRQIKAIVQLDRAYIAQDRDVGRARPQAGAQAPIAARLDRDSLRADRQGDAVMRAGLGDVQVDAFRLVRAAGHGRNQQRRAQIAAQKSHPAIDGRHVQLGQGVVKKADLVKAAVQPMLLAPPLGHDAQMIRFAPRDVRHALPSVYVVPLSCETGPPSTPGATGPTVASRSAWGLRRSTDDSSRHDQGTMVIRVT